MGDAPRRSFVRRRLDPDARLGLELTLFAAATFLVAVPFAILLVFVRARSDWLLDIDTSVADSLHRFGHGHPAFVHAMRLVSTIGGPRTFYVLAGVLTLALLWRARRLALWVAVTMAGAALFDKTLKAVVGRARPHFEDPMSLAPGYSFPSGHALASIVGCGLLLLVLLPFLPRRARPLAGILALVIPALVGFSRVGLGVHYVSDVVAGWVFGLAWLAATVAAFRIWRRQKGEPAAPVEAGLDPAASTILKR